MQNKTCPPPFHFEVIFDFEILFLLVSGGGSGSSSPVMMFTARKRIIEQNWTSEESSRAQLTTETLSEVQHRIIVWTPTGVTTPSLLGGKRGGWSE